MAHDDGADVGAITHRAYARIGLFGNPSDGYFGRTISCSIQNFYAEVTLVPDQQPFSSRVSFEPGPYDWNAFNSLGALAAHTEKHGHYGGVRLLRALCCRFHAYCAERAIPLHATGFCVSYKTNIPKQTGLSGSSSIIVAGLRCLLEYYDVTIPLEEQPALVLACERDLGIVAGLQDRVIQCYEGVVAMDFTDERAVRETGRGTYRRLPESCLPPLYLVYAENPGDSGKVHSDVKARWERGDEDVREKMARVADVARRAETALMETAGTTPEARLETLASLMNENFDLRRAMFGDEALGAMNIAMVTTPRSVGAAAKFTGSGGAAVVLCPKGDAQAAAMREACERAGFTVVPVIIHPAPSAA
jgi:glucuronokinase